MTVLEQGKTPSCSISRSDDKKLERLGLKQNGVSDVFSKGLKALEKNEDLREKYKQFDAGQITLGELLNELKNI